MPSVSVELFSKGYYNKSSEEENIAAWQYVGSPLASEDTPAKSIFTKSWIYSWDEEGGEWFNERATLLLKPFVGYATTQSKSTEGMKMVFNGQLVSNKGERVIPLAYSGEGKGVNRVANSYTAPIDITTLEDADFSEGVDPTIYLFNTGSRNDAAAARESDEETTEAPGQYLSLTYGTAAKMGGVFGTPTMIAPMQAFSVHENAPGTMTLNYAKHVWNGGRAVTNVPLRTKKHNESNEVSGSMRINIKANGWADNLYMLESEDYAAEFERGIDARKIMSGELNVFAVEDEDNLAVNATNSIIGTHVGVRTGEETAYTLYFSHLSNRDDLALYDAETNETKDINEGTEYTFFAEPNMLITDRFQIVERDGAEIPSITTDVENVASGAKAHKFIKNNQLYILKNGVLYTATGAVVR